MKKEIKVLNEVGAYAIFDEEFGNGISATDTGVFVDVEEEDEEE